MRAGKGSTVMFTCRQYLSGHQDTVRSSHRDLDWPKKLDVHLYLYSVVMGGDIGASGRVASKTTASEVESFEDPSEVQMAMQEPCNLMIRET
jgi:hypothetical protein